jgi:CBS domain-containing protein
VADAPRRALTMRDLMTTRLVAASPEESVAVAAEAMVRQRVGSALIMQGSFLAGILTERVVLRAAASGSDLTTSPVSAWISSST